MLAVGKKVNELRVCDLKDELEKRKLETVGPKPVLIERLERVRSVIRLAVSSIPVYNERLIAGIKRGGSRPQHTFDYTGCKGKEADAVAAEG